MKDKLEGKIIDEFVGLKSMMYSMNLIQQKEKISRLNLMNLKTLYLTENTQKQNERNSKEKHKVGTQKINKISLSLQRVKKIDSYRRSQKKRDSKRFSQKEKILTGNQKFAQLKLSKLI